MAVIVHPVCPAYFCPGSMRRLSFITIWGRSTELSGGYFSKGGGAYHLFIIYLILRVKEFCEMVKKGDYGVLWCIGGGLIL